MPRRQKLVPVRIGLAAAASRLLGPPVGAVVLLAACTLGPDYARPPDRVPPGFAGRQGTAPVMSTTPWWLMLHDDVLTDLVERARRANPDLGRARAAVAQARAAVEAAEAGSSPQLNATGAATRERAFTPPNYYSPAYGYATAGFDAAWELDLWGKDRRTVEAATANQEAAEADAGDAMLTLLGDVARNYVELRGAQAQLAVAAEAVDNQRHANQLAARRFDGGDGSRLEILQGQTLLLQREATLPPLAAQAEVSIHALSTLCDEAPDALARLLSAPGPIPQGPVPDAGIPADLIRRRPDIRSAERQLAATVALIGAAIADQYPTLSLSGSLSFSGGSIVSMAALPLFAASPTLKLPLLDGGQREATIESRRAQAEQARFAYRTAVLKALREVEDALALLHGETLHRDGLRQTVLVAQKVVDAARTLYSSGATDFLQVLEAQKALNESRDALVQAEAARTIQLVSLFKALGGGWEAAMDDVAERRPE